MDLLNKPLILKNKSVIPPLLCAPMAGITHSAFRRLLADFGGYGCLYTEMLSVKALLVENLDQSPFYQKESCEGNVIYQLKLSGNEPIRKIIDHISSIRPFNRYKSWVSRTRGQKMVAGNLFLTILNCWKLLLIK